MNTHLVVEVPTPVKPTRHGRRAAVEQMTTAQRAILAAACWRCPAGTVLSLKQVERAFQVSVTYIRLADRLPRQDRDDVWAGRKPLVSRPVRRKPSLPAAWISSTEEERVAAICSLGPERIARVLAIASARR
jgi:hypothetical protein